MMIMQPSFVANQVIETAIAEVQTKKKLPGIDKLRLEDFAEGICAQILHIGPFSEEGPTIERLHEFIDTRTGRTGKHHEIYLSDIRRANPKKLENNHSPSNEIISVQLHKRTFVQQNWS
jgi:hypothetical protein